MNKVALKRIVAKTAIIFACALVPVLSSASQNTDTMNAEATARTSSLTAGGRIYVVQGEVFVALDKNRVHRVTDNEAIVSNTQISTGANSAALLKFADGQVVTLQSNSAFQVREYRYDDKKIENSNIVFTMFKGGLRFITGLIGQRNKQSFRLATPNATIGIRGTDFMVTIVGNTMYSRVLTGKITMTNAAGMKVVSAGQSAVVTSPTALATLVSPLAVPEGAFSELQSIPMDPSAIPAPAPVPPPVPVLPPPVPVAPPPIVPVPVPVPEAEPVPVPEAEPVPEPAKAVEKEEMVMENRSGMGLTGKVGTLGLGAELNFAISDSLSARVGLNDGTYKNSATISSLNYDFDWQLQTINAFADWYPFAGSFRATGGLLYNNNSNSYVANPTNGNYIINGVAYSSTQITSYQGTMSFNPVAPYIGIGWGNPVAKNKGWGLVTDIGVIYQGKPTSDLVITCAATCPPQLQTDASAENAKLQEDTSFQWWPVVSIGISYQW